MGMASVSLRGRREDCVERERGKGRRSREWRMSNQSRRRPGRSGGRSVGLLILTMGWAIQELPKTVSVGPDRISFRHPDKLGEWRHEKRLRKCLSKLRGIEKVEVDPSNQKVTVTGLRSQEQSAEGDKAGRP
ncbi:hypothetical protein CRG98_045933 [Punica granatum]|uniref:HMA domain-containing protein n=1 Tax=Punica granatum TaxID=22663 RepID=A0A2I0HPN0_PUNGR|nr:hypothetical protein CRG98_045933 [Punica granatum]